MGQIRSHFITFSQRSIQVLLAGLGSALIANGALALDVQLVEMAKGQDRDDGTPLGAAGHFIDFCVRGVDVGGASVQPPVGGSIAFVEEVAGVEYCFEQSFNSAGARDAAFPNGDYDFTIQEQGTAETDTITLSFNLVAPNAYADFSSPANGATDVPADQDLTVTWSYSPGACTNCAGTQIFLINEATDNDDFESFLAPTATMVDIPAASLAGTTDYGLELETAVGSSVAGMTDGADATTVQMGYVDINNRSFTTAVDAIEDVEVLKGVDRLDGTPAGALPYFAELCVLGDGIGSAMVTPPGGSPTAMTEFEPGVEFCLDQRFADRPSLDAAFTNGDYAFTFTEAGGPGMDSITVSLNASAPGAYADFVTPVNGATDVSPDAPLDVTWVLDPASCGGPCADRLFLFLDNGVNPDEIVVLDGAITETMATIDAADLVPQTSHFLELDTFNGSEGQQMTAGGDTVHVVAGYEDLNAISITTPEPGAGLLGGAALLALGGCGRRRRARRRR